MVATGGFEPPTPAL